MKQLIRGATLMLTAVAVLLIAGCAAPKRTESEILQKMSSTTTSEYRDTLENDLQGIAITTTTDRKEQQMTYAVMSEGIASESAMLNVPIQSLRDLPNGAGYTAKDGRAGVEIRKNGDRIEAIGRCDSINRLYQYYHDMSMEQRREVDSLQWELSWLKNRHSAQASELESLRDESTRAREKPPETRHWWALAGFAAGLGCALPARKLKNVITTFLKT